MPTDKELRAKKWGEYASKNRESLREKYRIRYHANIEEYRKQNAKRMRLSNEAKRKARLSDPDYQAKLKEKEESRTKRRDENIKASKANRKKRAKETHSDKIPPHQRKFKRGLIREDGMVFWRYQWDQLQKEKWVTQEYFNNKAPIEREKALKRAKTNPSKADPKRFLIWHKWKTKNDPMFALKRRCRSRIQAAIRLNGWVKPCKTSEMLGCDWPTLKLHIETQFDKGMSWENRNLWHIDHFHPLSDAKTEKDIIRLSHYTNLRPLWKKQNHEKGAKIPTIGHQLPLLMK
jgi:hypothetical protein